ncbi:uncharacterized protein LOC143046556 [Mytilus galloprovincialis]|uniref:uncharacterized protein LOC143046556 n=1 Tax=Mytilus galloprovincialis TaxID=29158 RepID=UPI003F7B61A5
MASDVDKDKGHSQYCLKLSVTPQGHPLQDFPEGYCLVRALYKAIRENDIIINHVSSILAEDGITLCHSNISINEYQSIIMQCDFHGRIEREKLNSVLSDGRLEGNLKAYIDGLKIKSTIGKQNIQIANLNVTILCAIVENTESVLENVEMSQSKKITTIPNYGTELLQTENLESEKEKEKETIEAVAESSCELDSRNEQLKADKLKLEKIEEADKPVTESSCEPDSRIEQVPTEKIKSQKDQDTNKSVAESNYVLESSSQQLPADTKVNSEKDEKVAKTVTEHRNDSETSSEELQIKLKSEKEEKATNAEAESNYSSERRGEQIPADTQVNSEKDEKVAKAVTVHSNDSETSSEEVNYLEKLAHL